jgi:DNA polymerase-3 subunit alpha
VKRKTGYAVRFGLTAIKNVGQGRWRPSSPKDRRTASTSRLEDLCRRADLSGVNRRVLESLIRAGALDCLGDRATLNANVARILDLYQRQARLRDTGQSTRFDLWGQTVDTPLPGLEMEPASVPQTEKLLWEKELTASIFRSTPSVPTPGAPPMMTSYCAAR